MAQVIPKGITANRQTRILQIEWNDGHLSEYPFGLVRAACPCASCRGGHENMSSEPDPDVYNRVMANSPETSMANLQAAGSYALSIAWEDGHTYGIFTWHYLRALCPCRDCRKE